METITTDDEMSTVMSVVFNSSSDNDREGTYMDYLATIDPELLGPLCVVISGLIIGLVSAVFGGDVPPIE
jgi:hypothetical protein